jgi:hypothetical protein
MWMAGGGVKPGTTYGATDDFSYNVAENPVHVRDLHATVMHQLGIDHERFTFRAQGLDFKLTGVEPTSGGEGCAWPDGAETFGGRNSTWHAPRFTMGRRMPLIHYLQESLHRPHRFSGATSSGGR